MTAATEETAEAGMTSHTGRLYALGIGLLVFFLTWSAVAARPWASAKADPRLAALALREQRLRHQSVVVQRLVRHRWTLYRVRLRHREAQIAAARRAQAAAASQAQLASAAAPSAGPSVRVVTLPPLTVTRTS
jgi:hypothetical protein